MLIGRDAEIAAVGDALDRARLVTITGPGGVGKTSLALAAVERRSEPHVTALLAPLEPGGLKEQVAGASGFSAYAKMAEALQREPRLIILDNCEHIVGAAVRLAEGFIALNPGIRVLATSREPLNVDGEYVIRLRPLPVDGFDSPGVELFRQAAARRGVNLRDAEADIIDLCRRLDGLPLALELAAARSSSMTAAEMAANLAARLDVLSSPRRSVPDRHQSLAAAIAWSYALLDPGKQRLLNRLAVFPGPFTAEMAGYVMGRPAAIIDDLSALVEQSLLVFEPVAGRSWYRLLDTIRTFAAERLAVSGEALAVEQRLITHLAERSRKLSELSREASAEVPHELRGSFRTIRWAVERCLERDDSPSRAYSLISPLWWMEDVGYQAEVAAVIRAVLDKWTEPSADRGLLLGILAAMERIAGRRAEAESAARSALEQPDGMGAAHAHRTLGQFARSDANWAQALEHFNTGAALARSFNDPAIAIEAAMHGAITKGREGDVAGAIQELEELRREGERYPLSHAWVSLFLAWVTMWEDPLRARSIVTDVLDVAEAVNNWWAIATSHVHLAVSSMLSGELSEAADHLQISLHEYDRVRNRTDITLALDVAAALFARRSEFETARRTAATSAVYETSALGTYEKELLNRVGPVPDADDAAPLSIAEIGRKLRSKQDIERHSVATDAANRFQQQGDLWNLTYAGTSVQMPDSKGLGDLHTLIGAAGREIPAMDLMGARVVESDLGAAVDDEARQQVQARIEDLEAVIGDAEMANDPHRAERARVELDSLLQYVAESYGLAGRPRPQGDTAERARSAVTARIRSAIRKIEDLHPALGKHLDRSVSTGRFCCYDPAEPTRWSL